MHTIVSRTYAAAVFLHVILLLGLAWDVFLHGGHAAPGGTLFLLPSVPLAALIVFLWRGRPWAAVTTFVVSFVPGVWPLLWGQLTGSGPSPDQATIVIAGRRLFFPWWEIWLLVAPVSFAALSIMLLLATAKTRSLAD